MRDMKDFLSYCFHQWQRTYFNYIRNLCAVSVFASSFFVEPGEAALYIMTINELYKI